MFRSNRYIYAQVIDDQTGRTLAAASSQEADLAVETLTVETATESRQASWPTGPRRPAWQQ